MDYKHIEILPLYAKPLNLIQIKTRALVCGWETVSQDDVFDDATGDAKYSQNLHCMELDLLSPPLCRKSLFSGDFQRKVICGQALGTYQIITWVIASKNCLYVQHLEKYIIRKQLIQYKVKGPITGLYPIAGQKMSLLKHKAGRNVAKSFL